MRQEKARAPGPGFFFADIRYIGCGVTIGIGAVLDTAKTEAPQPQFLSLPTV